MHSYRQRNELRVRLEEQEKEREEQKRQAEERRCREEDRIERRQLDNSNAHNAATMASLATSTALLASVQKLVDRLGCFTA